MPSNGNRVADYTTLANDAGLLSDYYFMLPSEIHSTLSNITSDITHTLSTSSSNISWLDPTPTIREESQKLPEGGAETERCCAHPPPKSPQQVRERRKAQNRKA